MVVGNVVWALLVVLVVVFVGQYWYWIQQKKQAIQKLDEWLVSYRERISVDNRITCNRNYIAKAFPEYNSEIHSHMWKHCVSEGWVRLDDRDKTWVLVP